MSALYPSSLPAVGAAVTTNTLAQQGHTALHNNHSDEIVALATKIGTGASTPAAGSVLRATGSGTSTWGGVVLTTDVSGTLGVGNGGTGTTSSTGTGSVVLASSPTLTNPVLSTPAINTPVITLGGSWSGSPTLGAPIITSFNLSQHDHSNGTGGGVLNTNVFNNPYKFYVYRNGAWTSANGSLGKVAFDAKLFDTSSNFDSVTNNRFTTPINGFYQFNAIVSATVNSGSYLLTNLYKNGSSIATGNTLVSGASVGQSIGGSWLVQASANDYFEIFFQGTGGAGSTGSGNTWFSGFLVSGT